MRKKHAIALFEAISHSKESRSGKALPIQAAAQGQPPERSRAGAAQPEQAAAPAAPSAPSAYDSFAQRPEPLISTAGGRLRLSLNHATCTAVGAVLLVLLALMFFLGRKSVAPAGPSQASAPSVKGDLEKAGGLSGTAGQGAGKVWPGEAVRPKRETGKYYLVIQQLPDESEASKSEGDKIAEFCQSKNQPAEVVTLETPSTGKRFLAVWSLTGLDSSNSKEARDYAAVIEKMGEEYFAKHKTYSFQQRRRAGGPLEPYFLQGNGK
jgi:hypothetical protein